MKVNKNDRDSGTVLKAFAIVYQKIENRKIPKSITRNASPTCERKIFFWCRQCHFWIFGAIIGTLRRGLKRQKYFSPSGILNRAVKWSIESNFTCVLTQELLLFRNVFCLKIFSLGCYSFCIITFCL